MIEQNSASQLVPIADNLPIVDPHCHFWQFNVNHYSWLGQQQNLLLGDVTSLQRDFSPADYISHANRRLNIKKLIHVEAATASFASEEVEAIVTLTEQEVLVKGLMAGIELERPDVEQQLVYYKQFPQVKGVRQILSWHDNPCYCVARRQDYLMDSQWRHGYSLLAKYNFSFAMQVMPHQLSQVIVLANEYPDVPMVITHAGMPIASEIDIWRHNMSQLANCQHIMVQLSGFGMIDHHWSALSITPLIEHLLDCFGVDRCFFASNFPVDNLYCSFTELIDRYHTVVSRLSWEDRVKLFASNAERFYRV